MLSADQIKATYGELKDELHLDSGRARRRLDFGGAFEIWASVLYPSKHLGIELGPFRQDWLPADWATRSMKGFQTHIESDGAKAGAPFRLVLELQDMAYEEVFCVFAASIAGSAGSGMATRDAARKCWGTLERWRNFFAEKRDCLGRKEQIGLFGELWIISKLADDGLELMSLLDSWTGALRTDQDFQFKSASLEVKTTTAVESDRVKIASARQLDDTGIDLLVLTRVSLDERQNGGISLPKLIDELKDRAGKLSAGSQIIFEERLAQAGYAEEHRPIYETKGYSERSVDFFMVGRGFPRILESELPSGIVGITYDISMASCEPFRVTKGEVCQRLGELTREQ